MVDLGLYNYIQKELAEGKSRDEITQQLQQAKWNEEVIKEAWAAAEKDERPEVSKKVKKHGPNTFITILILVVLVGLTVFITINYKKIPSLATLFQSNPVSSLPGTSSDIQLSPYSNSQLGVTVSLPTNWPVTPDINTDGSTSGFTASGNLGIDNTATIELDEQVTTLVEAGVVVNRRSTLSQMPSLTMLKDADTTIGGQSGHIFEYTYQSGSLTYHVLEGYVVNLASGELYTFTAKGLDADWSQIPAIEVLSSLRFSS